MRYGAMNFPVAPVLEEIIALGELNMDYLELAMDPPKAHYRQIRQLKGPILAALARYKMGLVCHLPTFVYTAHLTDSIRRASLNEVIASLETAADLGAEKVVVHPGYIDGLAVYVLDDAMALAMESLAEICMRGEFLGVTLCIENMFPRAGPFVEPEELQPIFQAFPELKLVLDTGHANIDDRTGNRIEAFISQFGGRLEHVHLSDNSGYRDEHMPLGYGNIGFKRVVRLLCNIGYDNTMTLEVFTSDRSDLVRGRLKLENMLSSV